MEAVETEKMEDVAAQIHKQKGSRFGPFGRDLTEMKKKNKNKKKNGLEGTFGDSVSKGFDEWHDCKTC